MVSTEITNHEATQKILRSIRIGILPKGDLTFQLILNLVKEFLMYDGWIKPRDSCRLAGATILTTVVIEDPNIGPIT